MMIAFMPLFRKIKALDLQAKVILILVAVIFPISLLLGVIQSKVMAPILNEEIRQVGLSFAQNLASQIESRHLLSKSNANALIEDQIQRMVYAQPSVIRVDVIRNDPKLGRLVYLASSIEEDESSLPPITVLKDQITADLVQEDNIPAWSIYYPVKAFNEKLFLQKNFLDKNWIEKNPSETANIRVLVSVRLVAAVTSAMLKINLVAAFISTILLILLLSYFLKRAIENEKQLRVAQISNEVLSERLQETQKELIHTEKLAVMGQLTASFAHEIGTPLNAISGHMQLLKMDLENDVPTKKLNPIVERMQIISGQLKKIEEIVKGFLQTTKKPIAQDKINIPVKELVDRILALVIPTLQRHQISFGSEFNAVKDQVEVVPLEIEQVILNLVNNAIDSMREKVMERVSLQKNQKIANALWIRTYNDPEQKWVMIEIEDSGMGISEENLKRIFKPFFTTKSAGEGHGLGLSICQQILRSYGGDVIVDSRVGQGTKMKIQLPASVKGKVA